MTATVPVLLLAAMDPVARQSAALGLLLDLPDMVVVSYDHVGGLGGSAMRRLITDRSGVLAEEATTLHEDCLCCAVREDALETTRMLLGFDRWQTITISLPLTAAPEPVAFAIGQAIEDRQLDGAALASVISLVDLPTLEHDLLGDDLLVERGMAFGEQDRRSVGEAVAAQVEFADDIVTLDHGAPTVQTLLGHLLAPSSRLHVGWHRFPAGDLLTKHHHSATARDRLDPLQVRPNRGPDEHGVWSVQLSADQPLHPDRLLHHIEALGTGRIRSRGYFWLASRPDIACLWDGSGGQLAIGDGGPWQHRQPGTQIRITGTDVTDRHRITDTFPHTLTTPADLTTFHTRHLGDDGFAPWLGPIKEHVETR